MILIAIYARLILDVTEITRVQYGTNPVMDPPSWAHPFGTDNQGRDIFQRVLYGAWFALLYGVVTVAVASFLGIIFGIVAAFYGNITDNVIMRSMDILLAFPALLLALALVMVLPRDLGIWRAVIALILVYTPRFARIVRGAALSVIENDYIEATTALGASDPRVLFRHILPNCMAPITVQSTLDLGLAIINIAALSFLGFGALPGTPDWGLMLANGVEHGLLTGHWWWSFFPGLFLALTVLGFNLLGDGLRDALDPRLRNTVR